MRANRVEYLALVRESTLIVLRIDESIVHGHIEYSTLTANELHLDSELLLDRSRQTGSSWKVVSNDAILDGDLHLESPKRYSSSPSGAS